MLAVIESALGLISAIITHLNLAEARKYIDSVVDLKTQILAEEAKGVDQIDDGKLQDLYGQLSIAMQALQASMMAGMTPAA